MKTGKRERKPFYINTGENLIFTLSEHKTYWKAKEAMKQYDAKVWISRIKTPPCGNLIV